MTAGLLYLCGRLALAGVLAIAVVPKLRDPRAFRTGLQRYGLLPSRAVPAVAALVIAGELAAVVTLVAGVPPVVGPAIAAVLFGAFSVALLVNVAGGRAVPCHCFGASEAELIDWTSTLRTLALALAALGVLVLSFGDHALPTGADLPAAVAIAAGLVLVVRLVGFLPAAWGYLRAPAPSICGSEVSKHVSLKGRPLDVSIEELFLPWISGDGSRK